MRIHIALFFGVLALMVRPASAQTELMVNGGFEAGTLAPWVVQGAPSGALNVLSAVGAHAGSHCLLLANGNVYSQNVYQTVTFPTNLIAATLSFYFNIVTTDLNPLPDATLSIYITDINQNVLANFGQAYNFNTTGGYVPFATNLVTYTGSPNLSYAGKTVQVHFASITDGLGSSSQFYLDDVSMQVATTANIPANDDFTNLTILTGSKINLFANNTFATKEPGEPYHAGNAGGHSLWWGWVAPTNGTVSLNNAGSSFQTLLAVYTGGVLTNLTPVAAVNNGTSTTLSFKVAAGTEYDIAVDGYNGATGNIVLNQTFAPDVTPPKVSITAPANGANLTNAFFLLQGKASDNVAVAQVQYRLENAAGTNAYQAATGTTNWSVTVTNLIPGPNTVRVLAFDTSSNVSPAVASTVNYLVGQPLTLSINGSGTVSGATNGQLLHVGVGYKITALPKTGFGFAGWTGTVVSNAPVLTFVMQTNLALQANFMDIARPTLTITNPVRTGARWSNEVFTVSGKCADNVAVSNVWISWNTGAWMTAGLSPNGSNWSETIPALVPGTNTFAAYAVDSSGNVSLTNTTKLIYVLSATLTVSTNGRGNITPNDNGALLQLGTGYSLTAKPATGFGFVNWTDGLGNIITNGATLKFIMASNLTFVANFADITRPTLSITSPTANQKWSNEVFTVSGKCADNVAVTNVWISWNTGAWMTAGLSPNGSNWSETIPALVPGTNTFAAYAVDSSGNVSLTNTTKLIYVLSDTLTVSTNGGGTITPNYNGKLLQIGAGYAMTAKAATGFDFVNWTDGLGNIITNGATLKFLMASNLTFVANFADTTRPTLSITSPTASQKWSNAVFTVTGKCADNVAVSNVLVSVNSGDWLPATSNGSNWLEQVSLVPGTNFVSAFAVDTTGNVSLTNTVKFIYVPDTRTIIGTWNLLQFMSPAEITYDINNGLQGGGNFSVTNGSLTFDTNGNVSGVLGAAFTGTYTGDSNGVINATLNTGDGIMPLTFYLNAAKDAMSEVDNQLGSSNDVQEIVIGHRLPPSLSAADVAGTWNVVQFQTPVQLTGDLNSGLQGNQSFGATNGILTLNANGTFSAKVGDSVSGTFTIGTNGDLTLHSSTGDVLTFYVNLAKDTLMDVNSQFDSNNNQQELILCYRVPASVALADLVGTWNLVQFTTPAQMLFDGNNVLQGGDNFSVATGTLTVNANGTINGTLGDAFTGSVSVGGKGAIRANIITSGSNQTFTFYLNAGKNSMSEVDILIDTNDNRQELVTAHRVPAP